MVPVSVPVHRLSVEDVYKMVETGVLDRIELVEGVLVDMVPIEPLLAGAPTVDVTALLG